MVEWFTCHDHTTVPTTVVVVSVDNIAAIRTQHTSSINLGASCGAQGAPSASYVRGNERKNGNSPD